MLRKSKLLAAMIAAAAATLCAGASAAEVKGAAYADLRYGLDYYNDNDPATPDDTQFNNHGSHWGFKGSAEQGGITGFGGYERWLDADGLVGLDLVRQAYGGVSGFFGTVQYGQFATAYMESGRKLDPFYATAAAGTGRPFLNLAGGQSHGMSFLTSDQPPGGLLGGATGGFAPNQLAYTTPGLFGVTANVAVFFDEASGEGERDDYAAGLEFTMWGVTAGVQHLDANGDPALQPIGPTNLGLDQDEEATRLYAGLAQPRFGVSVSGERIDLNGGATDADFINVSAWFGVLDGTRLAASYGYENETGTDGDSFRVGVFHDVVDNFTTHVVYRNYNATEAGDFDDDVVSLGASFRFELNGSTTTR